MLNLVGIEFSGTINEKVTNYQGRGPFVVKSRKLLVVCLSVLIYCVPAALALLGPAAYWDGGVLGDETTYFITQYTAERPTLHKIFDPQKNDGGAYQARELSYFFDYLDAKFYFFILSRSGRVLFIPLSAFTSSLLLVLIFALGARRTTDNVDTITGVLLLTCFLSSFVFVSTMGLFYRSGKPLVAATVLAYLFHVRAVYKKRIGKPDPRHARLVTIDGVIALSLASFAGLLDRQGAFYVFVACVVLFVHYGLTRQLRDVLISTCAAAVFLQMYNVVFAPLLIRTLNGYWPDFWLQEFSLSTIRRFPIELARALKMLLENTAVLFGGFQSVGLSVLAVVAVLLSRRIFQMAVGEGRWLRLLNHLRDNPGVRTFAYFLLVFGFQVVMFALMIEKHPPTYHLDHRYHYLTMPYLAVVLFASLLLLDASIPQIPPKSRRLVSVLLIMLAASNMLSLNHYRDIMKNGDYYGPVLAQSDLLKTSLRSGVPDPRLDTDYRLFFDYNQRLSRRMRASDGK